MTTVARKYTIELHSSDLKLIAVLENAYNISYTEVINEAPTLSFDLPADDVKAVNITKANEIWLRNYETGAIVNKFGLTLEGDVRR